MKRTILASFILLIFCASDVVAKTRHCDSSNHRIRGTVVTADGKQHLDIETGISIQAVKAKGSHWRPPIARRRACRKASKTAASIIANKDYKELAKTLCRSSQARRLGVPVKVRPERAIADGWHGSENNDHALAIAGEWVRCETNTKVFSKPKFRGKPVDWCLKWKEQCGKPAAEQFCKKKGYRAVKDFSGPLKAPETSLIGTPGQTCSSGNCQSFRDIMCIK